MGLAAPTTARDWRLFLCAWLVAMALALCVDRFVASHFAPDFFAMKVNMVARTIEHGGQPWFLLLVVVVVAIVHTRRLRAPAFVFTSSLLGAVLGNLLKWMVGRTRPVADMQVDIRPFDFDFFRGGLHGLGHQHNLCFPSGHAIQVFSLAACLSLLFPRAWYVWHGLALVVMLERVVELAHYPSDIVGGILVGAVSFLVAVKLFGADRWR
jgi:undecaprenyl-diphosphatase